MSVSCKSNLATLAWSTIWATGSIWTVGATTLVSKYNIILKVTRQQKNIIVYFYCCSKLTWLFFSMEQKECWGITASVTIHFVLNKGGMEVNGDWGCQSLTSAICVPCKNNIGKSYGFKPALCLTFRFSLEKFSQLTIMSKTLWIHIFFLSKSWIQKIWFVWCTDAGTQTVINLTDWIKDVHRFYEFKFSKSMLLCSRLKTSQKITRKSHLKLYFLGKYRKCRDVTLSPQSKIN